MNLVLAAFLLAITVTRSYANHVNSTLADDTEKGWKSEGVICPHKDYKSYVKCLQSHKRREVQSQATSRGTIRGGSVACVEECERESCRHESPGPCAEVCYDRCLKKTKEIHHRITEYETTCGEGEECDNGRKSDKGRGFGGIANLTTSIDIRNYLNNTNVIVTNPKNNEESAKVDQGRDRGGPKDVNDRDQNNTNCNDGKGCGGKGIGNGNGNGNGNEPPRGFQPWYPAPSLTLVPQIQMVPQVTFGLGISPGVGFGTGCPYASVWLCFPQQQQQQQTQQVRDCSGCEQPYPYKRGRCDPAC